MATPQPVVRVYADAAALARAGAELFCELAGRSSAERRPCVALSGGSTPKAMFALLAAAPFRDRVAWDRLELFWSDERAVPPDDEQSNYGMARDALLSKVTLRPEQVHRMPAEQAPIDRAAATYQQEVVATVPGGESGAPRFHLVFLGMGGDGHTASLFPESPALDETERLVAPNYVAKLGVERLTFTPKLINAAADVVFLVAGADKAARLAEVIEGPRDTRRLPSQLIRPAGGTLHWLIDEAAAAQLRRTSGHRG